MPAMLLWLARAELVRLHPRVALRHVIRAPGADHDGDHGSARALPVDPALSRFPARPEARGAVHFVCVDSESGRVEATVAAGDPHTRRGRAAARALRAVVGAPLRSTAIAHEQMRKLVALPVLSADALSSVAYGPEAMLAVLVFGGSAGLALALPVAAVIALLMLAVGVSYRQTIRAYPHGGGSYVVASANLGARAGLFAAGGLIVDYVITVAISIAAGLAAVTSAVPALGAAVVPVGAAVIGLLVASKLRGARQAGRIFAAPTYAFVLALAALVAVGLSQRSPAGRRRFRPRPRRPGRRRPWGSFSYSARSPQARRR